MNLYGVLAITVLDLSKEATSTKTVANDQELRLLDAQIDNHVFLLSAAAAPLAGLVLTARVVGESDLAPLSLFFILSAAAAFVSTTIRFLIVAALKLKKTVILSAIARKSKDETEAFFIKNSWHEMSIFFGYLGFAFFGVFLLFLAMS